MEGSPIPDRPFLALSRFFTTNGGPSDLNPPVESTSMIRGFRQISGRALCLLAAFGLLAATPGCGDGPKKEVAADGVPANVKESNSNMENFMKTQKAKK
jgi:hypothetical protein